MEDHNNMIIIVAFEFNEDNVKWTTKITSGMEYSR